MRPETAVPNRCRRGALLDRHRPDALRRCPSRADRIASEAASLHLCGNPRHRGQTSRERAKEAGLAKGISRKAPPKLVEGATVQGWNAAYGALSLAFPGRLEVTL